VVKDLLGPFDRAEVPLWRGCCQRVVISQIPQPVSFLFFFFRRSRKLGYLSPRA
jgi:hypothetical protein